jgi:two-component system chemotaxis response regulator CheY
MNILPKNETKIVMVTALDTAQDVIEAYYKGGCTSYLVKPIEKKKILKALKDLGLIE